MCRRPENPEWHKMYGNKVKLKLPKSDNFPVHFLSVLETSKHHYVNGLTIVMVSTHMNLSSKQLSSWIAKIDSRAYLQRHSAHKSDVTLGSAVKAVINKIIIAAGPVTRVGLSLTRWPT